MISAVGYLGEQKKSEINFEEMNKIISTNFLGVVNFFNIVAKDFEKRKNGDLLWVLAQFFLPRLIPGAKNSKREKKKLKYLFFYIFLFIKFIQNKIFYFQRRALLLKNCKKHSVIPEGSIFGIFMFVKPLL